MSGKNKVTPRVAVLIGIIALLGGIGLVVMPLMKLTASLEARDAMRSAELERATVTMNNIGAYQTLYTQYESCFTRAMQSQEARALFMKDVEALLRGHRMVLDDIKPVQTDTRARAAKTMLIEVEATASMQDLVACLYALRTTPSLMSIDRLTIDSRGKTAGGLSVRMIVSKTM